MAQGSGVKTVETTWTAWMLCPCCGENGASHLLSADPQAVGNTIYPVMLTVYSPLWLQGLTC